MCLNQKQVLLLVPCNLRISTDKDWKMLPSISPLSTWSREREREQSSFCKPLYYICSSFLKHISPPLSKIFLSFLLAISLPKRWVPKLNMEIFLLNIEQIESKFCITVQHYIQPKHSDFFQPTFNFFFHQRFLSPCRQ